AAWHIGYEGDAPVWQDLAARLARGVPDAELRLPWRAPGMLWLVLRDALPRGPAFAAATLCAVASNLVLLSSGVHAEALYLALALVTLLDQKALAGRSQIAVPLRWGALHGALCLFRTEHLLTFAVLLLVARVGRVGWRRLLLAVAGAALLIVPWQLRAAALVREFNAAGEPATATLRWQPDAIAAVEAVPVFAQRPVVELVEAAVRERGATVVEHADLAVVRDAYGTWPEPLPVPWIALYGPLNFFLANSPEANGGYSRRALDRDPPLAGGAGRYPEPVRRTLGREKRFSLGYPPHLDLTVHGYARGLATIAADPFAALTRAARKLWYAAEGATGGIGGYALPIGLSGVRRPVDFVTATGWWARTWRIAVLLVAGFGLWRMRANRALWPLFAFAATKLMVIAVFFGYARHGALCLPVVAVGVAAAFAPWGARCSPRPRRRVALAALAVLLLFEVARLLHGAAATVDGRPVSAGEPFGAGDYERRRIEFR
ncbi:MAG: hypothetical protein KDE27_00015, partial [Planctomycetes bacterium]|nr:hypothetical protein [Planctomycetota bacterium]